MKLSSAVVSLIVVWPLLQPAVRAGQSEEAAPPATASAAEPVAPAPEPAPPATPAAPMVAAPPIAKDASKASAEPEAAAKSTVAGDSKSYVIGPLDVLIVKVWNTPQLSGPVDVRPDGMISIPLIGEFKADGLTIAQLKEAVKKKLAEYYNNDPDVDIQLGKVNSKRYFVYGGVGRPGEFPLIQKTTIMDALSEVGGFKEFAKPTKIRIQRGTQTFYFNYKDFSRGKNVEKNVNIELQSGDRIYVPE